MVAENIAGTLLRGMGQIMLQNSPITGALFLAGIFINSPVLFAGAFLGLSSGTVAAIALKYGKKDLENGLYGFNGALVGIASFFFMEPGLASLALIFVFSSLSSIIMNAMLKRSLPAYTFPFVLSAWLMLALNSSLAFAPVQAHPIAMAGSLEPFLAIFEGLGQVMFQSSAITGAIFLAGLFASSRSAGAFALLGAISGLAVSLIFSFPLGLANAGIFCYNGVLSAIAFCNEKKRAVFWAIAAAMLSSMLSFAFLVAGVPVLTAAFVLATWCALALKKRF